MSLHPFHQKITAIHEEIRISSTAKKAIKLLQLTTNIVIDLASKDSGDCEDILEELRLATVIVSTVGNEVKESLATCNDTLNTPKLLEKFRRPGMSEVVLGELLVFSTALFPQKSPMPGLADFLKSLSHRPVQDRKYQSPTFLPLAMAKIISSNTLPSQEQISDIVLTSLNMASSPPLMNYRPLTNLKDLTNFIRPLSGLIPQSQQLQNDILSSLVTDEVSRLMPAFLSAHKDKSSYTCSDYEVCPTRVLDLQKELSLGLCMLFLRAGVYTRYRECVGLDPELASALLEKLQLSAKEKPCSAQYFLQSESKPRNIITLFEASSTPENRANSHNWRHRLYSTLQGDANRQHESIIAVMGEICRDLETRCEGVEQPLYEEVERSKGLRREIEQLRARLDHEVQERLSVVEAYESLGQEKDDLEGKFEEAVAEAQKSLSESIKNAQSFEARVQELENLLRLSQEETQGIRRESLELIDKLNIAHQSELHAAKIAADKLAVDHIATLNGQQETIEVLEGRNKILEQECRNLREQHESLRKEQSAANERIQLLDKEIAELTTELEVQRSAIFRKNGEIETLEISLEEADEEEKELNKKISGLETKLETMESLVRRLENKIDQVTEKSLQDCRKLEADHSSSVIRLKLAHEKEVQGLHAQIQKTKDDRDKERATHFTEKRNLMGRIDGLRAHQEQKAKEAEKLARQLLGAMTKPGDFSGFFDGVTSETAQAEGTPKEQTVPVSSIATTQPIMSTGRRRSSPTDDLGSPSSSPTRNGSTPKRPKMRTTSKSPNQMHHRINYEQARSIPDRGKTTGVANKEDYTAVGDFIRETPTEIDAGLNQNQTLESNYGGTALFTSTPKLGSGACGLVGTIGSEYDGDDTTMDYSL